MNNATHDIIDKKDMSVLLQQEVQRVSSMLKEVAANQIETAVYLGVYVCVRVCICMCMCMCLCVLVGMYVCVCVCNILF